MKLKKPFICFAAVTAIVSLILFSSDISSEIKNGISICLNTIIPSLFCFTALSVFLIKTDTSRFLIYPIKKPMKLLFGVDSFEACIVLLSLVGGYPVGASLIATAVREQKLSPESADRLLCFCVNAGPAFLIGVVGIPILKSMKLGLIIYLSHILSCLTVANITRTHSRTNSGNDKKVQPRMGFGDALIYSAKSASGSMLTICSLIILFSAIYAVISSFGIVKALSDIFAPVFSQTTSEAVINGVLEICKGCQKLNEVDGITKILLASGLTAFGGICVHMQIAAIINSCKIKLNIKKYMLYRLVYTTCSVIYTFLFLKLFRIELPVISSQLSSTGNGAYNHVTSAFLVGLFVLLLFNFEKSDILNKRSAAKGASKHSEN